MAATARAERPMIWHCLATMPGLPTHSLCHFEVSSGLTIQYSSTCLIQNALLLQSLQKLAQGTFRGTMTRLKVMVQPGSKVFLRYNSIVRFKFTPDLVSGTWNSRSVCTCYVFLSKTSELHTNAALIPAIWRGRSVLHVHVPSNVCHMQACHDMRISNGQCVGLL